MTTVVVVAGGPEPPPPGRQSPVALPPDALVIAADGGADVAALHGLPVELVVGDLDSISPAALAAARRVERHPADKDATDLELALAAALRLEPERVLVLAAGAGRLDHLLGSLLVLASDAWAGVEVDARIGAAAVHVVRGMRTLHGEPGELVSLLAAGGPAAGIVTEGLVYPLRGETLEPGSSRGISNVFAAAEARIRLERGVLLAVRPTSGSAPAGG